MDAEKIESVNSSEVIMLKDLINVVIDQAKALPKPWPAMSQDEQQEFIDSAEAQIREIVGAAINNIACRGTPTVAGIVDQVVFKDGAKVVIKFSSVTEGVHDLADAQGNGVQIIIPANPDDLIDGSDLPEGEPNQQSMDLGSEDD